MRTLGQAPARGDDNLHIDTRGRVMVDDDNTFDWHAVRPTTPEQDRQAAELAPEHLKAHYLERAAMDPETRRAEYELRLSEAEANRAAQLAEMQRESNKGDEIKLKIAEKQLQTEQVRKGTQTKLPAQADPNSIKLKVVRMTDITERNEKPYFLLEPYLIADSVVGFYGKGGSGKSSLIATMAAEISNFASTLWISTEETEANNLNRYMKGIVLEDGRYVSAGQDATLQMFQAVVTKTDKDGRAIESMFNVYEHLEPAIIAANVNVMNLPHEKPVKLVVLDTIVALTTWDRQAGANSDEGVKRLMAFLRGVAERQGVTIAIVGHANKGKHDHFADSVMGATAWTTSPRLSFMHAKDRATDGQIVVRLAKGNEVPEFAQLFRLHMVHELAQIADGPKAGMFKVQPLTRVWGGQNAEELWNDVTTPPKDDAGDDGEPVPQRETVVDAALQFIYDRFTNDNATEVTRQEVTEYLAQKGKNIDRHRWLRVDGHFVNHPSILRENDHTRQNMVVYRRRT